MHRNFKNIDKVCYGKGAFDQLDEILEPKRAENDQFMVFIVDEYFKGKGQQVPELCTSKYNVSITKLCLAQNDPGTLFIR